MNHFYDDAFAKTLWVCLFDLHCLFELLSFSLTCSGFFKILNQELIMTNTPVAISIMMVPFVRTKKVGGVYERSTRNMGH